MGVLMDKSFFVDEVIDYWKKVEFLGQAGVPTEELQNKSNNKKARNGVKDKSGKNLLIKKVSLYHDITEEADISQFLAQDEQEYWAYPVIIYIIV